MPSLLSLAEHAGRAVLRRRGFASRTVRTAHADLHVYDAPGHGSLPPVVMVHGLGSAATPFGPVLARVRPHVRRVVAPELPGHGFSDAPTVRLTPEVVFDAMREALDHVIDEPAILCGNSLGGAIALRYALDRPAKLRGLVLVSPAGARFADDELEDVRRTFSLDTRADAVAFLGRLYHRPPWFIPLLAGSIRERLRGRAVQEILDGARPEQAPSPEELASLTPPTLFLWGRSERLLPASGLTWFRTHLPAHAVIEEPDGVGHCPHFDDPAALAARIVRFARELP
jgi:pimeloyl-ACP methyl ester carboxylesterase